MPDWPVRPVGIPKENRMAISNQTGPTNGNGSLINYLFLIPLLNSLHTWREVGQRTNLSKWGHGPRHSTQMTWYTECSVLWSITFWRESHLICSSHIQRCWSFSEQDGPELSCLKACQIRKVHACFYKRTNEPCMSLNYGGTGTNLWLVT